MARRLPPLTPRQKQVLRLVARARTNKEIAANLKISRATVKRHMEIILRRLGLKKRIQVALYAVGMESEKGDGLADRRRARMTSGITRESYSHS